MSEKYQDLTKKYPNQFKNTFHIECYEGWHDIINSVCKLIENHISNYSKRDKQIDFSWVQIKSKFAGLRMYFNGGDEYISGVVSMAETFSYSVCEMCGEKGDYSKKHNWVETLCEKHRKENGYELIKNS